MTQAVTAIVIGAGIAGCSTAYALAKRGIKVTLLERHESIAQEASGNLIAALYPKLSNSNTAQSQLAKQGFMFTLSLLKQLPDCAQFFNACGQIQLAVDARETVRQEVLYGNDTDLQFQLLTADQASEQAGIHLKVGGLFCPIAGWVKPAEFCKALIRSPLASANISLIPCTSALTIEKIDNHWLVNARNAQQLSQDYQADIVVLCNANDIKQFSFCQSAAITTVRGQLNYIEQNSASQALKTLLCGTHYFSPAVNGLHALGASYAPNDANPDLSAMDTQKNLNALKQFSLEIYQAINQKNLNGRVAYRCQTLDYMPLAGQLIDDKLLRANPPRYNASASSLPWLNGLYVNAGHGSKGFITAPICGELIANLALNETPIMDKLLISRLNPSRFLLKELGLKQLAATLY